METASQTLSDGITVLLIFLGMSLPIITLCLIYYLKKRLEHKQILAAIEKGTPLSELRPIKIKKSGPAWIRNLTIGIILIIIGASFLWFKLQKTDNGTPIISIILLAAGIGFTICGLLQKKYMPQIPNCNEDSTKQEKSTI
jgi:Na+/melibiose symporter-like transporter